MEKGNKDSSTETLLPSSLKDRLRFVLVSSRSSSSSPRLLYEKTSLPWSLHFQKVLDSLSD